MSAKNLAFKLANLSLFSSSLVVFQEATDMFLEFVHYTKIKTALKT